MDCSGVKKENPVWDIAKFVMSFFIVGIHTGVDSGNADIDYYIVHWFARFAVPLFFCLAGYFLFLKIENAKTLKGENSEKVKQYSLRMLRMYALWTAIYLIPKTVEWKRNGVTIRDLLIYVEFTLVRGDSYVHLWYLSALFAAVFIIWFLNRYVSLKVILALSAVCYGFGLLWLPHHYLIEDYVVQNEIADFVFTNLNRFLGWPRNGLFFALIFVVIGAMLSRRKSKPLSPVVNIILALLFMGLSFKEVTIIRANSVSGYAALQLFLVPAVYFIFNLLNEIKLKPKSVYIHLRKCSTYVYCVHPMVMFVLGELGVNSNRPFVDWILVFVISLTVSYVFGLLEKQKCFVFLKKLH